MEARDERRWDNRGHFFAAAAEAMRRILVDRARKKRSTKRGAGRKRLDIDALDLATQAAPDQLLRVRAGEATPSRIHAPPDTTSSLAG